MNELKKKIGIFEIISNFYFRFDLNNRHHKYLSRFKIECPESANFSMKLPLLLIDIYLDVKIIIIHNCEKLNLITIFVQKKFMKKKSAAVTFPESFLGSANSRRRGNCRKIFISINV